MCLQGMTGQQPAGGSPSSVCPDSSECTLPLALDDPFLTEFTDLHSLLSSTEPVVESDVTSPSLGAVDDNFPDSFLGLETSSPSSGLTSNLTSPLASILPPDSISLFPSSPENKESSGNDDTPQPSPLVQDKYRERRLKNNIASQISRAKRRAKTKSLFQREKYLEEENARLRVKVDEMTRETKRLRTMLITKLTKCK